MVILILFNLKAYAQIITDLTEEPKINPGKIKIISVKVKNEFKESKTIRPVINLPDSLNLIFPIKKFKIEPFNSKKINMIIQSSNRSKAGLKVIKLNLMTKEKSYHKRIRLHMNKKEILVIKPSEVPDYINKVFSVKLKIINKGNTVRILKIKSNHNFKIKTKRILIKPFKSKNIKLQCKSKHNKENPILNIRAVDQNNKSINLLYKKLTAINQQMSINEYDNYLDYKYIQNHKKKITKKWLLHTEINANTFMMVSKNAFNLRKVQDNYNWQLGTDYNKSFKLKANAVQTNNIKFSYTNNEKQNLSSIFYTDFQKEIGAGLKYNTKELDAYLESKKIRERNLNYYFKLHYKGKTKKVSFRSYKIGQNQFQDFNIINDINQKSKIRLSLINKTEICCKQKKYISYTYKNLNKKIKLQYKNIKNKKGLNQKFKIKMEKYKTQEDFKQFITLNLINNKSYFNIEDIAYGLKNKNYYFTLKKDFLNSQKKLKYKLSRIFRKKRYRVKLSVNNFGLKKLNLSAELNYQFNNGKELSFSGKLNYNQAKKILNKYIKIGFFIPFTIKLPDFKQNKIEGQVITAEGQVLEDVVLSINGIKVKTKQDGNFVCYLNKKSKLNIRLLDLNKYQGKYVIKKTDPYLSKEYNNKNIKVRLVKYGKLKVNINKTEQGANEYLNKIQNKRKTDLYLKLYNDEHYFIKRYRGKSPIVFKKIPPGKYNILIENHSHKYKYIKENNTIEIKSGLNNIKLKEIKRKRINFQAEEKLEKLEVEN